MKRFWIILFVIFIGAGFMIYFCDDSAPLPLEAIVHRVGTGKIYEEVDVPKGRLVF